MLWIHPKKLTLWATVRVARWPVFHRPGRYFTEAGKTPVFWKSEISAWIRYFENKQFSATSKRTNAELLKL